MPLLARLTPKRRAVLILRFFQDLSVEQRADAVGCSTGTVKTHTHRVLADLRALMGQVSAADSPDAAAPGKRALPPPQSIVDVVRTVIPGHGCG